MTRISSECGRLFWMTRCEYTQRAREFDRTCRVVGYESDKVQLEVAGGWLIDLDELPQYL